MPVCCVEGQSKRNALVQVMPIYMYVLLRRSMAHVLGIIITKDAEFLLAEVALAVSCEVHDVNTVIHINLFCTTSTILQL